MGFNLFYSVPGRRQRHIEIPGFYLGFVSDEDVKQLHYGLKKKSNNEPSVSSVKQSAIQLAKNRKDGKK